MHFLGNETLVLFPFICWPYQDIEPRSSRTLNKHSEPCCQFLKCHSIYSLKCNWNSIWLCEMLFPITGLLQNIKSSKIQLLIQHSHKVKNKIETKLKTIHGACMVWYVCVPCVNTWRLEEYTMCLLYHSPHYFGPEAFLSGHAGWQTSSQDLPDFVPNSSVAGTHGHAWLLCRHWDVNSGPAAFTASNSYPLSYIPKLLLSSLLISSY